MDTSSNVAVQLAAVKVGEFVKFTNYRMVGHAKYDLTLKVQRGIPVEYRQKFPNHEALANTYFLSFWKGDKKVQTTQISGDLTTIGLVCSLIMKKGPNEANVKPGNPTGKSLDRIVEETYNF